MRTLIFIFLSLCFTSVFAKPVNINKADAQTISEALPGIGVKKAEAIVEYRKKSPFKSVDELDNVKGIGKKLIDKNRKDILLVDPPGTPATSGTATPAEVPAAGTGQAAPANPPK